MFLTLMKRYILEKSSKFLGKFLEKIYEKLLDELSSTVGIFYLFVLIIRWNEDSVKGLNLNTLINKRGELRFW